MSTTLRLKLSDAPRRFAIAHPKALRYWCLVHSTTQAQVFEDITIDGTLMPRLEQFAKAIELHKPSMLRG